MSELFIVIHNESCKQQSVDRLSLKVETHSQRQAGNLEVLALTDGLYRMFKLRTPGWNALRELGMSLVGRMEPLKRQLARRAMGLSEL